MRTLPKMKEAKAGTQASRLCRPSVILTAAMPCRRDAGNPTQPGRLCSAGP